MLLAFADALSESSALTFGLAGALVMGSIAVTAWAMKVRAAVDAIGTKAQNAEKVAAEAKAAAIGKAPLDEMRTTAERLEGELDDHERRIRDLELGHAKAEGKAEGYHKGKRHRSRRDLPAQEDSGPA